MQTVNSDLKAPVSNSVQPGKEESHIEDGIIPDITEVGYSGTIFNPNPINEEAIVRLKIHTSSFGIVESW